MSQTFAKGEQTLKEESARVASIQVYLTFAISGVGVLGLFCTGLAMRQRNSQRRAALANARLSDALGNIDVGMTLFSADDTLALRNPRFAELFPGDTKDTRPGRPFGKVANALATASSARVEDDFIAPALPLPRVQSGPFLTELSDGRFVRMVGYPTREGGTVMTLAAERRSQLAQEVCERLEEGTVEFAASLWLRPNDTCALGIYVRPGWQSNALGAVSPAEVLAGAPSEAL
ncbi:MAG: hypothetical protein HOI95_08295 [Chromatiales bacterium]|nr:hypothetical protein [Chromatiales bacterium]